MVQEAASQPFPKQPTQCRSPFLSPKRISNGFDLGLALESLMVFLALGSASPSGTFQSIKEN